MDRRNLSGINPPLDDSGFLIHQRFQSVFRVRAEMGCTAQHFIGKQPAFAWHITAHFQLALDIGEDLVFRNAIAVKRAQRIQPHVEQLLEQSDVDRFLRREIVKQVRLGHLGCLGNAVHRCTVVTNRGKHLERGLKDIGGVALLDARLGGGRNHQGRGFQLTSNPVSFLCKRRNCQTLFPETLRAVRRSGASMSVTCGWVRPAKMLQPLQ